MEVILVYLVVLAVVMLVGNYIRKRAEATPYQNEFAEAETGEITEEK